MKFIFADSHDYIDPNFDFVKEQFSEGRRAQLDDVYPHEYFEAPPYDGMLVSRATVGDEISTGTYTTAQSMRFRRDGAQKFLRFNARERNAVLLGDCGAFSYVKQELPPYSVENMVDFYEQCGFTHGVSIDHAILGYDEALDRENLFGRDVISDEWNFRYKLTLRLAKEFKDYCDSNSINFKPIGVGQGWSPDSYANAARVLVNDFGYDYIALGGLVPLKATQIKVVLDKVRDVTPNVKIHLFGFTKADELEQFVQYNIESFDSTSPMLRAFKDGTKNYYTGDRWYTAIRIPQANDLAILKSNVLAGIATQKMLRIEEQDAIEAIRRWDSGGAELGDVIDKIVSYSRHINAKDRTKAYYETLSARPWDICPCKVCKDARIDVVIFRGSNRNRRRGFHNLWQFHQKVKRLSNREPGCRKLLL
jgi:hypothetical protein